MALVRAAQKISSSNSASPSHDGCSYDVFLSFRGEDTRKSFTDHLYTAFVDQGFRTFRDDDEIERGEDLNPELQKAIQHSRSSVIVFSKEYASSRWCLDEVVMILQRKRTSKDNHVVLPVFYDVDPTQVRKQTGSFEKAFAEHQNSTQWSNKVKQWRAALSQVADLAGMVLQNEADGPHITVKGGPTATTAGASADGIPLMNQFLTTSVEVNPGTSLPRSLVSLSLRGCNLTDDAFLGGFGNLPLLQKLDLSENPICSLPNFIKGIARLHKLSFVNCTMLKSLEELPEVHKLIVARCTSLEKVTFQSILCEELNESQVARNRNLVEFGHRFKCEPIGRVDVEMINLLGLFNLESMSTIQINWYIEGDTRQSRPIQGVYEYGIFSTYLPGNKVPGWFSHKSTESSISFIAPNQKIRGLNVFVVYAKSGSDSSSPVHDRMIIKVRNKSKGVKWIYGPKYHGLPDDEEDMIWLSHWKMENQFEGGDEVVVSVLMGAWLQVKEWGINVIVHEEEENMTSSQHNTTDDPCYPFVIGADFSRYEKMPGTYFLFWKPKDQTNFGWNTWLNNLVTDSDEDTDKEEEEHQLQLQDDRMLTATRGGDNKYGLGGWKGIIMAAGFFLSLSLFARSSLSRRQKQQSTIPS